MALERRSRATEKETLAWHYIVDKHGKRCGTVRNDIAFNSTGQLAELIVLSECPSFSKERRSRGDSLWVLHLEWKDGIAERRGLGHIDQESEVLFLSRTLLERDFP
jgi:hypothetical protein